MVNYTLAKESVDELRHFSSCESDRDRVGLILWRLFCKTSDEAHLHLITNGY